MHPSWYRGKEVTAEDFQGLESYILDRLSFGGAEWGIEHLDLESAFLPELEGSLFRLEVNHLTGVTDQGHPVRLTEPLVAEVRVSEPPFEFDVDIAVNPAGPDVFSLGQDTAPKFVLRLNGHPSNLEFPGGVLDLGAYRYCSADGLTCIARPRLRRLNALQPLDRVWEGWVHPWRTALEQRLLALKGVPVGASWRGVSWATELGYLVSHWPTLPLDQVVRRARYLRWLTESEAAGPFPPILQGEGVPADLSGDDLPKYLVELLGLRLKPGGLEPVAAVEGEAPNAPQPDVKLKWLPPDTLLARFATSLDGKRVSVCIPSSAFPPEVLEVRGGPAVGGFRVKEELSGEKRGDHLVYPLRATPREGETFRFAPVAKEAADGVYVTW